MDEENTDDQPLIPLGHAMAYDRVRGKVVLFGGVCNYGCSGSACNDTWEWDGTNWMKKTPASSPSSRWGHAMAYDSSRGVLVLFGGQTADHTLGDTWAWDGTNWTLKTPEFSPPPRANHTLALDRLNNVIVLFGGFTPQAGPFGDTWAWNGFVWEEISSSISPNARYGHAMTFDSQRAEIVLFGGYDGTDRLNDTWVFPR